MEASLGFRVGEAGRVDLRELLEQQLDPGFRLARAILLNDAEAEDAVQDACLSAWRKRSSLRDPDVFGAWFQRIVVNVCRDRLRRRRREHIRALQLEASLSVSPTDHQLGNAALDSAVDGLDVEHRLVVLLRYWQDMPVDEIARQLDIPVGTVKSRLHSARERIRMHLETVP